MEQSLLMELGRETCHVTLPGRGGSALRLACRTQVGWRSLGLKMRRLFAHVKGPISGLSTLLELGTSRAFYALVSFRPRRTYAKNA